MKRKQQKENKSNTIRVVFVVNFIVYICCKCVYFADQNGHIYIFLSHLKSRSFCATLSLFENKAGKKIGKINLNEYEIVQKKRHDLGHSRLVSTRLSF